MIIKKNKNLKVNSKKNQKWIGFNGITILILVIVYTIIRDVSLKYVLQNYGKPTMAYVYEKDNRGKSPNAYYRFSLQDSMYYNGSHGISDSIDQYKIGDSIKIIYLPSYPNVNLAKEHRFFK